MQAPVAVVQGDEAFREEVLDEVDHEQGIAFAAPVNQPREPFRWLMRGEPDPQVLRNCVFSQVIEWELSRESMRLQFPLDGLQWMVTQHHVDRSIRPNHDQPRRVPAPCQISDEVHGRVVAPVQILEHQDQGPFRRHRLEGVGNLAQHPLARGARRLLS